jgi:hypothetical protein
MMTGLFAAGKRRLIAQRCPCICRGLRSLSSEIVESGMDQFDQRPARSPAFWFLQFVMPILLLSAALVAGYLGGAVKEIVLDSHTSIQETVTGIFTLSAAVVAASLLLRSDTSGIVDWKLKTWLVLFVAAMIFFAGEDLNWGQHYFGWTSSDYFLENNREKESNLHNMWPLLFNRLPRAILQAWLIVACILVPLGWRMPVRMAKPVVPESLWPDRRLIFIAALIFILKGARIASSSTLTADNWFMAMRHSEVEELLIAWCLLLYALMLRERARESP